MGRLIAIFFLCFSALLAANAYANEKLPIELAQQVLESSDKHAVNASNLPKSIVAYQQATDIIIGRTSGELIKHISDLQENIANPILLYENFKDKPIEVGKKSTEYKSLKASSLGDDPDNAFMSNLLLAVYYLKQNDIAAGLSYINMANTITSKLPSGQIALNFQFDAASVALNGYILDRNETQAFSTLETLIELSELTSRSLDGYSIVNNIALIFNRSDKPIEAIQLIKTTEGYLDNATANQKSVYYYSLGRFQYKAERYQAALKSISLSGSITSDPQITHYSLILLADIYANLGDEQMSLNYKEKLLKSIASNPNAPKFENRILKLDAKIAELRGNYKEAFEKQREWSERSNKDYRAAISTDRRKANERILLSQELNNQQIKTFKSEAILKDKVIRAQKRRQNAYRVILLFLGLGIIASFFVNNSLTKSKTEAEAMREIAEEARDKAKAGERAKEQILAAMSHEFRTPLNAIIPVTDILQNIHKDAATHKYLKMVRLAGESLLSMIENLYSIANGTSESELYRNSTHIKNELVDVIKPWVPQFDEKNIKLSAKLSSELEQTYELETKTIKLILDNLLSNALKFTEEGHVSITIQPSFHNHEEVLEIKVSDTGKGIDLTKIESFLSPFTQADMSMTRRYGGLGIGLAAVKTTVDRYEGAITLDHNKPSGTIVSVTIPMRMISKTSVPMRLSA